MQERSYNCCSSTPQVLLLTALHPDLKSMMLQLLLLLRARATAPLHAPLLSPSLRAACVCASAFSARSALSIGMSLSFITSAHLLRMARCLTPAHGKPRRVTKSVLWTVIHSLHTTVDPRGIGSASRMWLLPLYGSTRQVGPAMQPAGAGNMHRTSIALMFLHTNSQSFLGN